MPLPNDAASSVECGQPALSSEDVVAALSDALVAVPTLNSEADEQQLKLCTVIDNCMSCDWLFSSGSANADGEVEAETGNRVIIKRRPHPRAIHSRQKVLMLMGAITSFLQAELLKPSSCADDVTKFSFKLEAVLRVIAIIGRRVCAVVERSAQSPQQLHFTVVVETYETFLSHAVLSGCQISTLADSSYGLNIHFLPFWLYLSFWSGLFSLQASPKGSRRLSRNVLFCITDSLLRQSISFFENSSDSLLAYSHVTKLDGDNHSPSASGTPVYPVAKKVHTYTDLASEMRSDFSLVIEGLSANGKTDHFVSALMHDINNHQEGRPGSPPTFLKHRSPSPKQQQAEAYLEMKSPRYVSPSAMNVFGDVAHTTDPASTKKIQKLSLQFAVKLGNLYATQDVHAMLSFLPLKSKRESPLHSALDDALSDAEAASEDEKSCSLLDSDAGGSARQVPLFGPKLERDLKQFIEDLPELSSPLSLSDSQSVALFISLCMLTQAATSSPHNFGRVERKRNRQVVLGIHFGYDSLVWPLAVSGFLDACMTGAINAACAQQLSLAKQLSSTIVAFVRHCYSPEFSVILSASHLHCLTSRWLPKCLRLKQDAFVTNSMGPAKQQLLHHFFFLAYYLRSLLNSTAPVEPLDQASETESNSDFFMSPIPRGGASAELPTHDQKRAFMDVLAEGERVLQAVQSCMSLLPWQTLLSSEVSSDARDTPFKLDRIVLPLASRCESIFTKQCIHYYLVIVDTLIEMALASMTFPPYLTSILLRFDESSSYLYTTAAEVMDAAAFQADNKDATWQRLFNYHCLSVMKRGKDEVDMNAVASLWPHRAENITHLLADMDSLKLNHSADQIPLPENAPTHSCHFLRILNHAKNVVRYLCGRPHRSLDSNQVMAPARAASITVSDPLKFVDGVSPYLSTQFGTFTQYLSVPHHHPFLCLVQGSTDGKGSFQAPLELACRDLWLRIQVLGILSAVSSPIAAQTESEVEPSFILNGSASKTYVRLLFLRIVYSVFAQQYNESQEKALVKGLRSETKKLYQLACRLWTACLTLAIQTLQCLTHYHVKARETALHLGVHVILSKFLDAFSSREGNTDSEVLNFPKLTEPLIHTPPPETELANRLDDTMTLVGGGGASAPPPEAEVVKADKQQEERFAFAIPELNLDGIGPPLYFVSSGDTGAALQASLFPGHVAPSEDLEREAGAPFSPVGSPVRKTPPGFMAPELNLETEEAVDVGSTIINSKNLYVDDNLLCSAMCCTCSLLVQHSGMIRYESTVSSALLRKRLHLPNASYHLLYGGDQSWKKNVKDTRNSAILKSYLGACCAEPRGVKQSCVFQSLRECIASSSSRFSSILEKPLEQHTLSLYRSTLALKRENGKNWRHLEALKGTEEVLHSPNVDDDASLHSLGLFVLLRLLIPRQTWNQQFKFLHRLGVGGFGTVMAANYKGTPLNTISPLGSPAQISVWEREEKRIFEANPHLAIKMMPLLQQHDEDSGMLPTCHAEVSAMLRLRGNPRIASILSFGRSEDGYFIVLPRYAAGAVHEWRQQHFPPGCAALVSSHPGVGKAVPLFDMCSRLMTQLLEAVVFMHSHSIRHNDIKADNLLIESTEKMLASRGGEDDTAFIPLSIRLADFGSCDTCTDEDMEALLGELVAGESKFMEGRWGFGKGTEAVQPPEIIVPRWRYEFMRAATLNFVQSAALPNADKLKLTDSLISSRILSGTVPESDAKQIIDLLRRIELSADIWGCGCLFYEMLTGQMLFGEGKLGRVTGLATRAREHLARKGSHDSWRLCREALAAPALEQWDTDDLVSAVGQTVVDFLQELLHLDPLKRPTATEALNKWVSIASACK